MTTTRRQVPSDRQRTNGWTAMWILLSITWTLVPFSLFSPRNWPASSCQHDWLYWNGSCCSWRKHPTRWELAFSYPIPLSHPQPLFFCPNLPFSYCHLHCHYHPLFTYSTPLFCSQPLFFYPVLPIPLMSPPLPPPTPHFLPPSPICLPPPPFFEIVL